MKFFLRMLLAGVIALLVFAAYSMVAYRMPKNYAAQTIIIPPHTGVKVTVGMLHEAGLTPSLGVMAIPLLASGSSHALKAGEYAFAAGLSPEEIIAKIVKGDVVIHKVTIPEGWNSYQVRVALLAEPLLTGELGMIAEGSLLPDTIHF